MRRGDGRGKRWEREEMGAREISERRRWVRGGESEMKSVGMEVGRRW